MPNPLPPTPSPEELPDTPINAVPDSDAQTDWEPTLESLLGGFYG